ncbi:MAG: hypothetical protein GXO64_01180 [Candidatus Micrarchaeota archaeon]|nr:hypothetical protein [Candidatus Micrarchaeota archaeon]
MEKSIQIVVVIIVILITAVAVLLIFNSGTSEWMGVFNEWSRGSADKARCQQECMKKCASANEPSIEWSQISVDFKGKEKSCSSLTGEPVCKCGFFSPSQQPAPTP